MVNPINRREPAIAIFTLEDNCHLVETIRHEFSTFLHRIDYLVH